MITKFKIFESLTDLMTPPTDDKIKKSLEGLNVWERIEVVQDNESLMKFYPTDEEIKSELSIVDDDHILTKDSFISIQLDKLILMIDSKYDELRIYNGDSDWGIYDKIEDFFERMLGEDDNEYITLDGMDFRVYKEKKVIYCIPDMGESGAIIFNINFDEKK